MPRSYQQLTYEERCQIAALKERGGRPIQIARQLKRHRSTITRELARNQSEHQYQGPQAEYTAKSRRFRKPFKISANVEKMIEDGLSKQWSPVQISGRLKLEGKACISHETIYKHIRQDKQQGGASEQEQPSIIASITDKMRLWEPIEEALYSSWANINDNRDRQDYLEEQKLAAVEIEGFVEPYNSPVKNKPGDFIIRENDVPVAYVYSTQMNLQDLVGTQVKLVATPRPNHNFAFPAYYVIAANQ